MELKTDDPSGLGRFCLLAWKRFFAVFFLQRRKILGVRSVEMEPRFDVWYEKS